MIFGSMPRGLLAGKNCFHARLLGLAMFGKPRSVAVSKVTTSSGSRRDAVGLIVFYGQNPQFGKGKTTTKKRVLSLIGFPYVSRVARHGGDRTFFVCVCRVFYLKYYLAVSGPRPVMVHIPSKSDIQCSSHICRQ